MKTGDLLKIALVGVGGYLAYKYLVDSGLWAQWFGGGASATPGLSPAASVNVGQMSVQTPSGNPAVLKVGDPWSVRITGAPPNAPVDVTATRQGNQPLLHVTGNTTIDASGNFVISGMTTSDHVGTWSEVWTVGGVPVGTWNFTITPVAGVAGVGAIIPVPNNGPIANPLPTQAPSMSFGGGGYGNAYGAGKKGNGYVQ